VHFHLWPTAKMHKYSSWGKKQLDIRGVTIELRSLLVKVENAISPSNCIEHLQPQELYLARAITKLRLGAKKYAKTATTSWLPSIVFTNQWYDKICHNLDLKQLLLQASPAVLPLCFYGKVLDFMIKNTRFTDKTLDYKINLTHCENDQKMRCNANPRHCATRL